MPEMFVRYGGGLPTTYSINEDALADLGLFAQSILEDRRSLENYYLPDQQRARLERAINRALEAHNESAAIFERGGPTMNRRFWHAVKAIQGCMNAISGIKEAQLGLQGEKDERAVAHRKELVVAHNVILPVFIDTLDIIKDEGLAVLTNIRAHGVEVIIHAKDS